MNFKNKIVVVTGGVQGIGKAICDEFREQGAIVFTIDMIKNDFFVGDIADESTLIKFANKVLSGCDKIDYLINNACLSKGGIENCSYDDFNYVLRVGISAPFMLSKLFMNNFNEGGSIVNISSTRAIMSQANTESYTAAKGGISALTHALATSLSGKVRVNSISPGWIDTLNSEYDNGDTEQHLVKRVGNQLDIAKAVMFLCSDDAGFITGENITIDSGMTKQMIYHNDFGWKYEKE